MQSNYCLPIIKPSKQAVLETIEHNFKDYSYFEVWLDYIEDLSDDFIKKLVSDLKEKLILLFRRQNLEPIKMDLQYRKKIISSLNNSRSYLDLDVANQQEELSFVKSSNLKIKLITSYHNYKQTPQDEELGRIITSMKQYFPDILKVSTMTTIEDDGVRLLQLLLALKKGSLKYIVLGMGEHGKITRIFGTLWGNEMIFAPKTLAEKSAPGQLTKDELNTIFSIIT